MNEWMGVALTYDPLKAGSIDSTDTDPHDRAVIRAMNAKYKPNLSVNGNPANTIFVSGLDRQTDENTLWTAFRQYGKISNCRLVRDIVTGFSKGYGFIEYEDRRDTTLAQRRGYGMRISDVEVFVDFENERVMSGWVPRRLGGGLGGNKKSGQLRFGGRERPFFKPIFIPGIIKQEKKEEEEDRTTGQGDRFDKNKAPYDRDCRDRGTFNRRSRNDHDRFDRRDQSNRDGSRSREGSGSRDRPRRPERSRSRDSVDNRRRDRRRRSGSRDRPRRQERSRSRDSVDNRRRDRRRRDRSEGHEEGQGLTRRDRSEGHEEGQGHTRRDGRSDSRDMRQRDRRGGSRSRNETRARDLPSKRGQHDRIENVEGHSHGDTVNLENVCQGDRTDIEMLQRVEEGYVSTSRQLDRQVAENIEQISSVDDTVRAIKVEPTAQGYSDEFIGRVEIKVEPGILGTDKEDGECEDDIIMS